jgi:Tol biopolymer transport system component
VPSWSPDGTRLAFFANPEGRDQLFVMDLVSKRVIPLAASAAPSTDLTPAFSRDGASSLFVSTRDVSISSKSRPAPCAGSRRNSMCGRNRAGRPTTCAFWFQRRTRGG